MSVIYGFLESLPLSMFQYDFMKNAFLAAVLIAPLFALLGTMAVNNKMAFFSDALGHSAFTGIGLGVLLGLDNPILAMMAFGIFLSLVITKVKAANMASSDTIISVFSSSAMALGIVILSGHGGFSKYSAYLVGDILTVSQTDLLVLLLVLIGVYVLWAVFYNQLLLLSINRSLAASRGVRVVLMENIFVIMVAVAVMVSIRAIGILMINSLLILPAAAARNVTRSAREYHWLTTGFGLVSALAGLTISYYGDTSAGATMVLTAAVLFLITYPLGKYRK
ncbi:metal ABC transporter permease [Anaerotignum sp.]|uniref:metal ABC transporter permease n=1 Tax=Anaerotignum sp. TaxID=2039241 RepID=UPI0029DA5924|nr:metal ABC transporter permease [Anaerotignum sp.]MCI6056416.1 metal ABC transporter permease [Clostridia bacterium]MDY3596610.1 metal ABC transporter permease [Anaerotignum sp.]